MRSVAVLLSWSIVTVIAAIVAPVVVPLDLTLHGFANAIVVGGVLGSAAFLALARATVPAAAIAAAPRGRLLARSVILTLGSLREEAIWRGLVLGFLAGPLGRLGALAVSTVMFAAAHVHGQGRSAKSHLVTGLAFGLAYVATGRLAAAMVAHASYNILVGASSLATKELSLSDTGQANRAALASGLGSRESPSMPSDATPLPVARLDNVVKEFKGARALDGIELELRPGEILALLGPNGAGKSTAVAILLGLRRPDTGTARLFGRDPRDPAARRHVGAVLQEITFPPALRVREAMDLTRAHFEDAPSSDTTLTRVGLAGEADRDAGGVSGGQRRRLAVALALAGNPRALFLDEPTAGMDATARRSLLRDIVDFAAAGGAVLLTTQQLAEAEEISSRVVVLLRGRVMLEGTVPEIRARAGLTRVSFRAETVPALANVMSVESRGDRHTIYVDDADALVADLVESDVAFRDLEVARSTLEDAFVTLTKAAEA